MPSFFLQTCKHFSLQILRFFWKNIQIFHVCLWYLCRWSYSRVWWKIFQFRYHREPACFGVCPAWTGQPGTEVGNLGQSTGSWTSHRSLLSFIHRNYQKGVIQQKIRQKFQQNFVKAWSYIYIKKKPIKFTHWKIVYLSMIFFFLKFDICHYDVHTLSLWFLYMYKHNGVYTKIVYF